MIVTSLRNESLSDLTPPPSTPTPKTCCLSVRNFLISALQLDTEMSAVVT